MPTNNLFGTVGEGDRLVVYTDGGSRGNPGPAAIGVVIGNNEYKERLGVKTNNEAEYMALAFALAKAKQILGKTKAKATIIEAHMDSELVVKQMKGEYKVSEEALQRLFMAVWNLRLDFKEVRFTHVPREANKRADRLVNEALDGS